MIGEEFRMFKKPVPYISCSSIGSTWKSSSLSESVDAPDEAEKGSVRYVDDGIVLAKSPKASLPAALEDVRRLLVGRSEALRMVGLALSISDMVEIFLIVVATIRLSWDPLRRACATHRGSE